MNNIITVDEFLEVHRRLGELGLFEIINSFDFNEISEESKKYESRIFFYKETIDNKIVMCLYGEYHQWKPFKFPDGRIFFPMNISEIEKFIKDQGFIDEKLFYIVKSWLSLYGYTVLDVA